MGSSFVLLEYAMASSESVARRVCVADSGHRGTVRLLFSFVENRLSGAPAFRSYTRYVNRVVVILLFFGTGYSRQSMINNKL